MDPLQVREAEIFRVMKLLEKTGVVLIGGYAVNAYTMPRFSVDCDLVVRKSELGPLLEILKREGFAQSDNSTAEIAGMIGMTGMLPIPQNFKPQKPQTQNLTVPYGAEFIRLEKRLPNGFIASFDILIDSVYDRQSGARFGIDWMFENSTIQNLVGKTINEKVRVRVATVTALFVMKLASRRVTDCRDLFMLAPAIKDRKKVAAEAGRFFDFQKNAQAVLEKATDPKFKNNLAGVYGYIDESVFKKHLESLKRICASQ